MRNPLYNESSWCRATRPFKLRRRKKKEARAERKDGRKEVARRRTRARPLLHGGPFFFGGFPLSFLLERGERRSEGRRRATELRKRGTTSRARVSARTSATEKDPLLRPYYIVYLSTASTTSLSRPSSSSSLLPPPSSPSLLLACPSPPCV